MEALGIDRQTDYPSFYFMGKGLFKFSFYFSQALNFATNLPNYTGKPTQNNYCSNKIIKHIFNCSLERKDEGRETWCVLDKVHGGRNMG